MRFQSLRALSIRLDVESDAQKIVSWIKACCVLHNIILTHNMEETFDEDDLRDVLNEDRCTTDEETDS